MVFNSLIVQTPSFFMINEFDVRDGKYCIKVEGGGRGWVILGGRVPVDRRRKKGWRGTFSQNRSMGF